jgi:hypothetical protein
MDFKCQILTDGNTKKITFVTDDGERGRERIEEGVQWICPLSCMSSSFEKMTRKPKLMWS